MFKKLFGLEPKLTQDGAYSPSSLALKLATKQKTDYDNSQYATKNDKNYKILMVCTQEQNMTMENGKKFSIGNHPVEMLVPMLHFQKADFDVDVFTPTGESVKIEMWAMPKEDEKVNSIYNKYKDSFKNPKSFDDFFNLSEVEKSLYIAVFIPGGHGAMLGLPENKKLGDIIDWVYANDKYMLSICHGPAALLAQNIGKDEDSFAYKGYKMAVFPDSMDKMTPKLGYMPGNMPWYFGERLSNLGVEIVNKKANGTCFQDRKLITGDSPTAANEFGKISTKALLKEIDQKRE